MGDLERTGASRTLCTRGPGEPGSRGERSGERVSSRGNRGCRVRDCSARVHETSVPVNETGTKSKNYPKIKNKAKMKLNELVREWANSANGA